MKLDEQMQLSSLRDAQRSIDSVVKAAMQLRDEVNVRAHEGKFIVDPNKPFVLNHVEYCVSKLDEFRTSMTRFFNGI